MNGCICCTVRGDLVGRSRSSPRRSRFDGVIIETTGLADPAPVAQVRARAREEDGCAREEGQAPARDKNRVVGVVEGVGGGGGARARGGGREEERRDARGRVC